MCMACGRQRARDTWRVCAVQCECVTCSVRCSVRRAASGLAIGADAPADDDEEDRLNEESRQASHLTAQPRRVAGVGGGVGPVQVQMWAVSSTWK